MLKFKFPVAATKKPVPGLSKGQSAKVKEKRRAYKEKSDVKQN